MSSMGNSKLNHRKELFRACAWLIEASSGRHITIKLLREMYKTWSASAFPKMMSFGEFTLKAYSDEPTDTQKNKL